LVPVQATKINKGTRGVLTAILNPVTRWQWVVTFNTRTLYSKPKELLRPLNTATEILRTDRNLQTPGLETLLQRISWKQNILCIYGGHIHVSSHKTM